MQRLSHKIKRANLPWYRRSLVSAGRASSAQKYPQHRYGPLYLGSILLLTKLGGEEDTLHPQALLAPRFCLEGLQKAPGMAEIISFPHAAITHVLTPMCRAACNSCSVLHRGWDKKLEVIGAFHHLQA